MRIERRFTKDGQSPYADIEFRLTTSEIRNPDGSVVFKADDVEVPAFWSQVAADVLAQKYFRKAGVPARLKKAEKTVPSFLWRSVADEEALAALPEKERIVGERSAKQVFDRLAGTTWTYWGWKGGYFNSDADAQAFFDEQRYMLVHQMGGSQLPPVVQHRPFPCLRHHIRLDQGYYYVDPIDRPDQRERRRVWAAPSVPRPPSSPALPTGVLGSPAASSISPPSKARICSPAAVAPVSTSPPIPATNETLPDGSGPPLAPSPPCASWTELAGAHETPPAPPGAPPRWSPLDPRPPGHRGVHRLEGQRGAEGRRPDRRLQDQPEAPQGGAEGLHENCEGSGDDCFNPEKNPTQARDEARAPQSRG